ncbi:MAG TPA: ATPase, T2SS/T4P/T4SS family [Candidatus Tectomicrobia bacterium]
MIVTASLRKPLGELLVDCGALTPAQRDIALQRQRQTGQRFGDVCLEMALISEQQLMDVLAEQWRIPTVQLRKGLVDAKIVSVLPRDKAQRYGVMPMFKVEETLTIATADPHSLLALDDLENLTQCRVQPVLCRAEDISRCLQEYYGEQVQVDDFLSSLEEAEVAVAEALETDNNAELEARAGESPVINLVNLLILKAIKSNASDIHLEPDLRTFRVRYRIDGVLYEVMKLRPNLQPAVAARLKVMANLDIAERRLPQEGRMHVTAQGREIDLRFSSMPTVQGEKIVLRLLDKRQAIRSLEQLGFVGETLRRFKELVHRPLGLVLVTGPTGSGKTTTLYTAIDAINTMGKNILTIEDPVEYQLELINQIQVRDAIGLSFARILRSVLRQDPDVIMVGEIRDRETAEIAIQAALTGHLVLSTLHTNDSAGAITRLLDMGVEPYLVSSAVSGVLAQRLVRTICPACKTLYYASAPLKAQLGIPAEQNLQLARGRGCEECYDSGFRGRVGIYEFLFVDDALRNVILRRPSTEEVRQQRQQSDLSSLLQEGFLKVVQKFTTIEEVSRAVHLDE